ncbi:cyclin-dependent kinase 20-like [Neodiprion virginianus]|uniref:cyclin-dependent kinase 20-like n=1 Tax=Neodiprion virginianus TaxID=2961670 RepID=UPI001EE7226D|nr:cyclin-dependent kinase 20-like [Neodiprion virginianus]
MEKYVVVGRIGVGAHGLVLKAYHVEQGNEVALKKVLLKKIDEGIPTSVLREVKTLQELRHRNVVELIDVFPVGLDFVMVFEYMPSGVWEIIRDSERPLNDSQKKTYVKMLFEGVSYMHANNVMHRDLKPANLLVNREGVLKIADFGLGRLIWDDNSHSYSHRVATRWYRAPELLYGARYYTTAVDIWAVGCIFGEILNSAPLFAGETDIEQLAIVLRLLGSPTTESWPDLTTLPDYNKITFPCHKGLPWDLIVPDATPDAIDLIKQLLVYNSSKRLTASSALKHLYFHSRPFPCPESALPKPTPDHRVQVKPEEVKGNLKRTVLFQNLLSIV